MIPPRPILIEQQHWLSRRTDPRARTGRLNLHQRDEAVDLRLLRYEPGQNPAEAERILTELGPHPVVAGGRSVPLIEYEVDDLEDRRQSRGKLRTARDLERNVRVGQRALCAHDPLRDRWLETRKARAISSVVSPPSKRRVSATRASGSENRMTGYEHEAQQIVAHVII